MYKVQYANAGKLSLFIPKNFISGLLINTDEEPVIPNTKNILIISHLKRTIHFFSNFLKMNRVNFKSIKNRKALRNTLKTRFLSFIKILDNLNDE